MLIVLADQTRVMENAERLPKPTKQQMQTIRPGGSDLRAHPATYWAPHLAAGLVAIILWRICWKMWGGFTRFHESLRGDDHQDGSGGLNN